jgi:hypothetical protein
MNFSNCFSFSVVSVEDESFVFGSTALVEVGSFPKTTTATASIAKAINKVLIGHTFQILNIGLHLALKALCWPLLFVVHCSLSMKYELMTMN